jgi:hypothetical protein
MFIWKKIHIYQQTHIIDEPFLEVYLTLFENRRTGGYWL